MANWPVNQRICCLYWPIPLCKRRDAFVWPARSPDITVPDFFLWGFLKSRIYSTRPQTILELKEKIREEINSVNEELFRRVMFAFRNRLQQCIEEDAVAILGMWFLQTKSVIINFQNCRYNLSFSCSWLVQIYSSFLHTCLLKTVQSCRRTLYHR